MQHQQCLPWPHRCAWMAWCIATLRRGIIVSVKLVLASEGYPRNKAEATVALSGLCRFVHCLSSSLSKMIARTCQSGLERAFSSANQSRSSAIGALHQLFWREINTREQRWWCWWCMPCTASVREFHHFRASLPTSLLLSFIFQASHILPRWLRHAMNLLCMDFGKRGISRVSCLGSIGWHGSLPQHKFRAALPKRRKPTLKRAQRLSPSSWHLRPHTV